MTGRYRLEDKTKAGKPRVTLFNVNTQQGAVFVDGKKLEGAAAAAGVKDAYATWINDMYWLSMPWKWMDMGVNLKYAGEKALGGKSYQMVDLSFSHVGLTPATVTTLVSRRPRTSWSIGISRCRTATKARLTGSTQLPAE